MATFWINQTGEECAVAAAAADVGNAGSAFTSLPILGAVDVEDSVWCAKGVHCADWIHFYVRQLITLNLLDGIIDDDDYHQMMDHTMAR